MTEENPIKGQNKPNLKATALAAIEKAAKESAEGRIKNEYKKIEEFKATQREHRKSIAQLDEKIAEVESVIDEIVAEYESRD